MPIAAWRQRSDEILFLAATHVKWTVYKTVYLFDRPKILERLNLRNVTSIGSKRSTACIW
jgi:hypothetical protein